MSKIIIKVSRKGGPGSGHWGHSGLPGVQGGSAPSKGGGNPAYAKTIGLRDAEGGRITESSMGMTEEYLSDASGVLQKDFDSLDYLTVVQYASGKIDGPKAIKQLQENQRTRNKRESSASRQSANTADAAAQEALKKMSQSQRDLVADYRRQGQTMSEAVQNALYDSQTQPMTRSERNEHTAYEERQDRRIRDLIRR